MSAHVIGQPWSRSTAKGKRWADFGLPNRGKDRQRWHGGMSGHGGLHKRRAVRARRTYTSLRCHNFTCTMRTTAHRTVPWGNPAVPSFPPLLATVVGAYRRGGEGPSSLVDGLAANRHRISAACTCFDKAFAQLVQPLNAFHIHFAAFARLCCPHY